MKRETISATFAPLRGRKILCALLVVLSLHVGTEATFAQVQPSASDQAYNTGMNHFNLRDYASAINTWENMLRNDPNYAEKEKVWYAIAKAAGELRTPEGERTQQGNAKAIEYLDKIINQKDAGGQPVRGEFYGESLYLIGQTFYIHAEQLRRSGDLVRARDYALAAKNHFDLLLKEVPNSQNVPQTLRYQTLIAVLYTQSTQETRYYTELAFKSILNDTAANQDILADCKYYYAWAIGQLGNRNELDEARRIFTEFITNRDPKRGPMSLYELAHTYYRAGEFQAALNELNRFKSVFPNDTSASLNVQRLQAMCCYHLEYYDEARKLMDSVVNQQEMQKLIPAVEDQIFLVLCYMKQKEFVLANEHISYLEGRYANTTFGDGLKFLRAAYYAELGQHQNAGNLFQNAIDLINPILGARPNYSNGIRFDKLPRNSEKVDVDKCGLTEEYYLRAASLLAICYARLGNMTVAWQVYEAMFQVSREMYGRYSTIRERTQKQLSEIERALQAGTLKPPSTVPPLTGVTTPTNPAQTPSLLTGSGGSTSLVTGSPGSTIQTGVSNSLAYRVMSLEEQERVINQLQTRADNAGGNMGYIDEVLTELNLLIGNRNISEFNHARVAIMRGELLYREKGEVTIAIEMAELAYLLIVESCPADKRNTETFVRAARGLGRNAARSGDHEAAAKYFQEALATSVGKNDKFRDELMYRYGAALLNIPGREKAGLGYFEEIDFNEKTSPYWSHAALQLAIADYKNGDYGRCEKTIDELIEVMPDKAILDRVLYLKGELAMRNEQWDIAADSFDAIGRYAQDSPLAGLAQRKRSDARRQAR